MKVISILNSIAMHFRIARLNANRHSIITISKTARIDKKTCVNAYNNTQISVGNNVYLRSNPKGYHSGMPFPTTLLADSSSASITIGDNSRLNGVYVHAQNQIVIGNNCVIAAGVNIIDSNGHEVASLDRTRGRDIPEPINIGTNVWIGLNAIILKGVTIGDNSIVAAGSVVRGGVYPDNSLISGVPAKVVSTLQIE